MRPSSGLTEVLFVEMLARDSEAVVSVRRDVVLPNEGLREPLPIDVRRRDVRGGGMLARSGSETSRTGERCKSGFPSCAKAFCTVAGDKVEETVVVGVEVGPVPLVPRLGLGLLLFLARESDRCVAAVWWL